MLDLGGLDFGFNGGTAPEPIQIGAMQIYFCPEDNCDARIIEKINLAQESIHVAVYSFTLDSISDALIAAHARGVEVKVVMDTEQAGQQWAEDEKLKQAGIDVRLDGNSKYMHNKFAIFDGKVVSTGSYNWTKNASQYNDENLIFFASEEAAQKYEAEFLEIFSAGN